MRIGATHKFRNALRPIGPRAGGWSVLLLIAGLAGCATSAGPRVDATASSELLGWVDTELAPYLVEQLSRHPRFKGEPVLLVATDGADVSPEIDALTASLRERLLDRLLQSNGVSVAWRPSAPPAEHHRRSPAPVCDVGYRAQYFIGLDIAPLPGGEYRLSVRALDRRGEGWVAGFGKSWQGRLLPEERRALARRQPDEYLRGLRSLPFEPSQLDLLAGYLARNLDCLLVEKGAGGSRVWVGDRPGASEADHRLRVLVERYLGRESQLTLVEAPEQAEVAVSAELRPIHDGLYQAWLTASAGGAAEYEVAVNTDGYIVLTDPAPANLATTGSDPVALLSRLRPGNADAVELDLYADAYVFGIAVGTDGGLQRVSLGGCRADPATLRPLAGGRGYVMTVGPAPAGSVYALATRDGSAAERLRARLEALPSACEGGSSLPGDSVRADAWLRALERDLGELGARVDWQGVRLPVGESGLAGVTGAAQWETAR
jgi:hypothetical protein